VPTRRLMVPSGIVVVPTRDRASLILVALEDDEGWLIEAVLLEIAGGILYEFGAGKEATDAGTSGDAELVAIAIDELMSPDCEGISKSGG
jgi:hypothetical protein